MVHRSKCVSRWAACLAACWALFVMLPATTRGAQPEIRVAEQLSAGDWPWWRGPSRDGQAGSANLPTHFSATEHVHWKARVPGRGHSSPIVVAGKVVLTTAEEATATQLVLAYDLASGELLWQTAASQGGFPTNNHPKNTEASSTPACDGERLFATFFHHQQIELVTLDLQGEVVWRKTAGPFYPKMFEYGYAPSPLLYGSSVIVAAEHDHAGSFIAAFDRDTGQELWRTERPASISFSTPVVAHVAGRDQLLISGQEKVCSYDPDNGKLLWEVAGTTHATCGTMVWDEEVVYASGGFPKAETLAVRADGSGEVIWRNNQKCYEQSMIVIDGCVYALTDKGVLYCWRASDGQELWRERLEGPVSASPIVAGGLLYWANEGGTFYVIRPNPAKFELVAANRLGSEAFASPAVSGDRLLIRVAEGSAENRQEMLYCISAEK